MQLTKPSPRILVVEDDFLIGMQIAETLASAGFTTQFATSIEEARNLVDSAPVDAVVLDFLIRDEVSAPFAHWLEQMRIPFVFCTGSVEDEVHEAFPGTVVVTKPFSDRDLVRAVSDRAAA